MRSMRRFGYYVFIVLPSLARAFIPISQQFPGSSTRLYADDKFGFGQRIASGQSAVVGALSGSLAAAPFLAIQDVVGNNNIPQWEFDTDTAALEGALFALVYRYAIRCDDNPQLKDGVVGAFVLVRTLSRISIPTYCSALPLSCGPPTGYLDWNTLSQLAGNGIVSAALFGAAAKVMDWFLEKKFISKFPG